MAGFWRRLLLVGGVGGLMACAPAATPVATPAATPLPPIGLVRTAGAAITASARVVPLRHAELALAASGRVEALWVALGERVPAGATLLQLEDGEGQAALTRARAAYFRAQAQLAELQAEPQQPLWDGAEAELAAAQARLAQRRGDALPAQLAAAEAQLAAAQAAYQALFAGPTAAARVEALAALAQAQAAVQQTQSAYDAVQWRNDVGALPQSRQLQEATIALEAAQAHYDGLFASPQPAAVAAAQAEVERAAAALEQLQRPATPAELAEAEAQVQAAAAKLALLAAGPRSETVAVAAGAVAEARALLESAEQAVTNLALRAPFTGTVTAVAVQPGEFVAAGSPALTLADLARLWVETTDLSERDVSFVQIGQPATVWVEALSLSLPGQVAQIAPQASVIGGDVVYTVWIQLAEQPAALRWGMSAAATIQPEACAAPCEGP